MVPKRGSTLLLVTSEMVYIQNYSIIKHFKKKGPINIGNTIITWYRIDAQIPSIAHPLMV